EAGGSRARDRRRPGRGRFRPDQSGRLHRPADPPRSRRPRPRRDRTMTEVVSVERDGAEAARTALERTVRRGGGPGFPADTLYGLACDPLTAAAVARIHSIKGRDEGKPSAVMYFSPLAMRELVAGLGPGARDAVGAPLPGAVTLVIANTERRYPLASRDDPELLGVRLIEGPLAGAITPIFQTSANPSGGPAPTRFEQIEGPILDAA